MKTKNLNAPDLTKQPPRSPRVRLGGYVILARCLDKGRASLIGKLGEYHFDCPLDKQFLQFAGIKADDLKKQLALGKGDGEILEWITKHSTTKPSPWEIVQWSTFQEQRTPADVESQQYFTGEVAKLSKTRSDITTWFEWLDLDDFVSFGGKA